MEYSILIPQGNPGIEWNGMEFGIFHGEQTSMHLAKDGQIVRSSNISTSIIL
jgi:tryptophan synthase beta subunit